MNILIIIHRISELNVEYKYANYKGELIFKNIQQNGFIFSALVTLMMLDEDIHLNKDKRCLVGLLLITLGSFDVEMDIDDVKLNITLRLVTEKCLSYTAQLGLLRKLLVRKGVKISV